MAVGLVVVAIVDRDRRRGDTRGEARRLALAIGGDRGRCSRPQSLFVGRDRSARRRGRCRSCVDILLGALVACLLAVLVGIGALRVKGLLLAISTMAFAIAAESYIFGRPIFTGEQGALTVDVRPRASSARST